MERAPRAIEDAVNNIDSLQEPRLEDLSIAMSRAEAESELGNYLDTFGFKQMEYPDQESLLRSLVEQINSEVKREDVSDEKKNSLRYIAEAIAKELSGVEAARDFLAKVQLPDNVRISVN
jgi:vacuolar-type H+-ATPase subunit I/STV1